MQRQSQRSARAGALVLALGTGACNLGMTVTTTSATEASTTTTDTTTTATTTSGPGTTGAPTTTSGTTGAPTSSDDTAGCTILCPPPDVTVGSCDPWLQDCPEGQKCNAWANDGGASWNANKCVPIDPNPDAVGEQCSVEESGVSGLDSCELGAMCWDVDARTNLGTCVALCQGSEEPCTLEPWTCCPPGSSCVIYSGVTLILCLQTCDPIAQDCWDPAEVCSPEDQSFECQADGSGDAGKPGDPCEPRYGCDPGAYCGAPQDYPDCDLMAKGCCIPFCELDEPECPPETECLPWFDPGDDASPFYENLGACVIP